MIKVVANNYIKPECVDEFLRLTKEIVEKTNANDKGCIKYELCKDINEAGHYVMLEEWESQADLDAHMKAPHFTSIIPQFGPLSQAKEGGIGLYEKVY
jgi:quinol monooxygenase YgiN